MIRFTARFYLCLISPLMKKRVFDPVSEDDMDDNGMSRYIEN